jgi:mono/diheme cytochrome c family protein
MAIKSVLLLASLVLLAGCNDPSAPAGNAVSPAAVPHGLDATKVARGAEVYRANCAACHGANAEGAPNWQKKGPDGKYPPPPLDATGHAWHHPKAALVKTIKEGTVKLGGAMPAVAGVLTDSDIEAVLAWIQ